MLRVGRAVTLALVCSSSAAADSSGGVRVTSTDRCLTSDSLLREIGRFRPSRREDARLKIALSEEGDSVVAKIYRDEAALGERRFDLPPRDCGERQRLIGLALAVALDRLGGAATEPEADSHEASIARPSLADSEPVPEDVSDGAVRAPARARPKDGSARLLGETPKGSRAERPEGAAWTVAVHGTASAGLMPVMGFGGGLAVGGRRGRFSVELGAEGQRALSYEIGRGEVDTTLFFASVKACGDVIARGALRVSACLGGYFGQWTAEGRGYVRDAEARRPWLAAGAGVRASWSLTPSLALRLDADAIVPTSRADVEVRDGAESLAVKSAPAGVRTTFGPELRF